MTIVLRARHSTTLRSDILVKTNLANKFIMQHTIKEIKLQNGARGLMIDVPGSQIIEYRLAFGGGFHAAPKDKLHLPHLLEHFLVAGVNEVYPTQREFHTELSKNGAGYGGYTSKNYMTYGGSCADFECERVLKLFLLAIAKPVFKKECFQNEMGIIREELKRHQEYSWRLGDLLEKKAGFASHTRQEALASLENIKLEDVERFYQQIGFTGNLRFIIAGSIKSHLKTIVHLLESIDLNKNENKQIPRPPREKLHGLEQAVIINCEEVDNLHYLFYTFCDQRLTASEEADLQLLTALMVGGFTSRIFGKASEAGLLYVPDSTWHGNTVSSSYLAFCNQVTKENAKALFNLFNRELGQVLAGKFTAQEVEAAKCRVLGCYHLNIETVEDVIDIYEEKYFHEGRFEDYKHLLELLKNTTPASITTTTRKMFADRQCALGLLGSSIGDLQSELHRRIEPSF